MKLNGIIITAVGLFLMGAAWGSAQQLYDLGALTAAAVKTDPDIQRLESGIAVDQAGLAGARASALPTVSFLNTYSYIANPQAPYVLQAGSLGSIPIAPGKSVALPQSDVTVVDGQDDKAFNFGLSIDQPIFLWGKIKSNIALKEKLVLSDGLQVRKQRDETSTMVAVNLYSLYYLEKIEGLLEEQKRVADDLLTIARDSLKAGQINDSSLIEKRMTTDQIAHAILGVSDQRETALRNLRYLTGIDSLKSDEISFKGIDENLAARGLPGEAELMARAARENSDLKLLQLSQQIHQGKIDIASADTPLKPDLALNVQLGYKGSRVPGLESEWDTKDLWYANVTLAINANIFDGGKARSAVDAARAQKAQTGYQVDATLRQVQQYISETSYELGVIRQNIDYYRQRAKDTQDIVAYQKRLLDIGSGSRLDYYQKRVDTFTEQTQVLQQKLSYATRYLTLMNVVGAPAGQ
ncbi:MAG TPA: TolC family protein [Spirochaetia bacterium]|nr:TolC family protein [Spirochaetia bacterium]